MRGTLEAHEETADVRAQSTQPDPGKHPRTAALSSPTAAGTSPASRVGPVTAPVVQAHAAAIDDPAVFGPFDRLDSGRPSSALIAAGAELTAGDGGAQAARDPAQTASIAAAGVGDASARLPHHDAIQRSFGHHDIGDVRVAQGPAAASAASALGAEAYTFGDRVALPRADLWTEAHEAAHTVQQRAGRVAAHGTVGDAHEHQADAIADRVVAGQSAVDLLDDAAAGAGGQVDPFAQLFTIKEDKLEAHWAFAPTKESEQATAGPARLDADAKFLALGVALKAYETKASVATTEDVLRCAKAFRTAFDLVPKEKQGPRPKQTSAQVGKLIDEAHEELQLQLTKIAKDEQAEGSPAQKVDTAVGQLSGSPGEKNERKRILRHQQELGMKATRAKTIGATDGPAIIQSWRARGDMYHVGAVLNLFPEVKVILYDLEEYKDIGSEVDYGKELELADRWQQACMIADYYNQPKRVLYTTAGGVAALGSKSAAYDLKPALAKKDSDELSKLFIDVGGCTTIIGLDMAEARENGRYKERKAELAKAVAPDPTDDTRADADEVKHYLKSHGWDKSARYVIINFRDSGHSFIQKKLAATKQSERGGVIDSYDPAKDQVGGNHPDLDTGVVGAQQLAKLVEARGFTPVFMGEEPADAKEPHLIKYWTFKHLYGKPEQEKKELDLCRGGRAAEAFFIRVVAESFDVRLLSMRSGVTDQLAFLGIPTISIDVDNFHQAPVKELTPKPGYQLGNDEVAHSWARGSKLEAGLGRDYGRAFISEERDLKDFDDHGKWRGEFSEKDLGTLDSALGFYFGTAKKPATEEQGVRHESHPFHPGKMSKTAEGGKDVEATLKEGAAGKIDTGLNPEVVLQHMASVLGREKGGVEEAVSFADSHLRFIEDGSTEVTAKDIEHRNRKLGERKAFLGKVIALLSKHGAAGKYEAQLDQLEKLGTVNGARCTKLLKAVAIMRQAVDIRMLDHKDKKVAAYFKVIDGIDLEALAKELGEVKAAAAVEQPGARLDGLASRVKSAHTTLTEVVGKAIQELAGEGKNTYYRLRFEPARDKLAEVVLP